MQGVWQAVRMTLTPDNKMLPIPVKLSILIATLPFLTNLMCENSRGNLTEKFRRGIKIACTVAGYSVCSEIQSAVGEVRTSDACGMIQKIISMGSSLPPRQRVDWYAIIAAAAASCLSRPEDFALLIMGVDEVDVGPEDLER
ncbi:MAG: hypothetical protein QXO22_04260 [Thermosphaera sp.]